MLAVLIGSSLAVGIGTAVRPLAGVAVIVATVAGLSILYRPVQASLVVVALAPILSGLRRGLPIPGLRLSEVLAVGVGALVLISADARDAPRWRAFDYIALSYATLTLVFGSVDLIMRGDPFSGAAVGTLLGPFQFVLLYRLTLTTLRGHYLQGCALRLILLASVPVALIAILQRVGLGALQQLAVSLTGNDSFTVQAGTGTLRAVGLFPHWQVLGGYLFIVMVLAASLLTEGSHRVLRQRWLVAVLVTTGAGMISTGTFTTLIAVVAAVLVLGVWTGHGKRVLAGLAVAGLVGAVVFGQLAQRRFNEEFTASTGSSQTVIPRSVENRITVWTRDFFPLIGKNEITGYGPALPANLTFPYTETLYITLLLRGGVPLLVSYAALMAAIAFVATARLRETAPEDRALARSMILVVGILAVIQTLEPYFITSGLPQIFWILSALLLGPRPGVKPGPISVNTSRAWQLSRVAD